MVWLSLLVSFLGVILVLKPNAELFDPFSIYGFISGIAVAFSQVLYGVNRENESLAQNIFLFFLYSTLLSFVAFAATLFFYDFTNIMKDSFYNSGMYIPILCLLGVGVGTIANQALRGAAYKLAKPSSLGPYSHYRFLWRIFCKFLQLFDKCILLIFIILAR